MMRRPSLYLPSVFIIFETLPSLLYVLMSRKLFSLHIISDESVNDAGLKRKSFARVLTFHF